MSVERKYERDIDLLLAEEFHVNSEFAERFKALTKFADKSATVADFWVSRTDNLGESDLIVVYQCADGERFALLIEDKVDANLQPDQAVRYRQRAERHCALEMYSDYEVVLCAPKYYIDNRSDLAGFDHLISLEQIAEMIRTQDDTRANYRADFLDAAGTRRINAWQREEDISTNEFWDAAYELATREFVELELKRPKMSKDVAWIRSRPRDFPTMPKQVCIILKGRHGHIDLTFSDTTAYLFKSGIAHLLERDMSVHQTSASAVIRIETPQFQVTDGIVAGMPKVKTAFEASSRLIALYRNARAELNREAEAATPV